MTDAAFLDAHNARHVWHPMAHPREMEQTPPRILARAEGVHVLDHRGHRAIDAVGGLWNVNLGYSSEPVKRAIAAQLDALPYASAFRGTTNVPLIELSETLTHWLEPEGMRRFAFTAGGSDSVEVALRLARQYWKLVGQKDRTKFLAFRKGYHGTHFGAASVNGNDRFRRPYEPLLPGCFHVPFPWAYRNPFGESDPQRLARLCIGLLEEEIRFQGPDTIAALAETQRLGLAERAARTGAVLKDALRALAARCPAIGEVRGIGLMLALECVADRDTKAPADAGFMTRLLDGAWDAGALIRTSGNVAILSPPLVLEEADALRIVDALEAGFGRARAG